MCSAVRRPGAQGLDKPDRHHDVFQASAAMVIALLTCVQSHSLFVEDGKRPMLALVMGQQWAQRHQLNWCKLEAFDRMSSAGNYASPRRLVQPQRELVVNR